MPRPALAVLLAFLLCDCGGSRADVSGPESPISNAESQARVKAIYDELTAKDDQGVADRQVRDDALVQLQRIATSGDAHESYYRAEVLAVAAELRGLRGMALVKEAYRLARASQQIEPSFLDAAAQALAATIQGMAGDQLNLGDSEAAVEELEGLVNTYPTNMVRRFQLGQVLAHLGDDDGALAALCQAYAGRESLPPSTLRRLSAAIAEIGACP